MAKLTDAETALAAAEKAAADQAAADAVADMIDALPETLTPENKQTFDDAYTAYQALTDDQKALLDQNDVDKLNDAMLAEIVIDAVNNLPENVTLADWATVVVARGIYDNLDDGAKAFIGQDTLDKLEAAEKTIADLQAAEVVIEQINELPSAADVTYDDKADIEAARAAYNALTDDQKALIDEDTYKKLTDAEEKIDSYVLLGDVDGDGQVTIVDATWIQRYLAFFTLDFFDEAAADVDGDGDVSILDATWIQRYLAEMPVKFPIDQYV